MILALAAAAPAAAAPVVITQAAAAALRAAAPAACAPPPRADDPPELPAGGADAKGESTQELLPADLPTETRARIIEAAIVEALRDEYYFGDAIRGRLEAPETIGPQVRAAATVLGLPSEETSAWLARAASKDGRASLATLVPEEDDADSIRRLVHRDLVRLAAPLPDDRVVGDARRARIVDAALRLLVDRMRLPGGAAIWGPVDDEVDRKIRVVVASRAPRPHRQAWCELAAWTLLAQGLHERALGVSEESARWLAQAGCPPSADFAAVRVLAQRALGRPAAMQEARSLFQGIDSAPPELRRRVAKAAG